MRRVAGILGLLGVALACQGCLVPFSKYIKLKRERDRLYEDLQAKDSQLGDLSSRLQALRDQLNAKDALLKLYEDKKNQADSIARSAREEIDKLQRQLDEFGKRNPNVEIGKGRVMLKDAVLFALGSAEISEQGQKILADLAREVKDNKDFSLQIDGHTDDVRVAKPETVQRFIDNWGLSAARAAAVLRLLGQHGIAENSMFLRAFSMFTPRVPNDNDANRAKNRRVEIIFLPRKMAPPTMEPPAAPEKQPAETPALEKAPAPEPAKKE